MLPPANKYSLPADEVEPDAFQGQKGLMTKLKMNVINIELVSRQPEQAPASNQPAPAGQPSYMAGNNFDFDDNIPF